MDITIAEAAERLGTSIPRDRRAIECLGIATTSKPNGEGCLPRTLNQREFERLRDELGSVPINRSRSREDLKVLAAFNLNSFGFRSRRAVAASAAVSLRPPRPSWIDLLTRASWWRYPDWCATQDGSSTD